MSTSELTAKIREYRELQALISEAEQEAEAIKDAIKAHMGKAFILLYLLLPCGGDKLWFNGRADTSFMRARLAAKKAGLVPYSYSIPQDAAACTPFSFIVVRIVNRMMFCASNFP